MMPISPNWYCIHPETQLIDPKTPNKPSNCGACECPIAGNTYHCSVCNSSLHPICKSPPPTLSSGLHPGHPLTLLNRNLLLRRCAICSEEIKGVSYACSPCNFDIHPQCSQLPLQFPCPGGPHSLHLHVAPRGVAVCGVCGSHCGKWWYKCDVCSISIHYSCLSKKLDSGNATPTVPGTWGPFGRGFYGGAVPSPWAPQPFGHGHYDYYRYGHGGYNNVAPGYYYNINYNQGGFHPSGVNQGYNNNNNNNNNNVSSYFGGANAGSGVGGLMGRIAGKIAGNLAVNFLSDIVSDQFFG